MADPPAGESAENLHLERLIAEQWPETPYLVAIRDWPTRKVPALRLSNTIDAGFCVEAMQEAMARFGNLETIDTAECRRFTGFDGTNTLPGAGAIISMDGSGRWMCPRNRQLAIAAILEVIGIFGARAHSA